MTSTSTMLILEFLAILSLMVNANLFCYGDDPARGFTALPFGESHYRIQKPYNIPLKDRYSFINGVHRMWVYSNDEAHFRQSQTKPRTELEVLGYNYGSGVWQFEGHLYVPTGTTGTTVMQIKRNGGPGPTTMVMMRVYEGRLEFYDMKVVAANIYNRWMRVNVIHSVDANKVSVFIDGAQKLEVDGNGREGEFYFKCGVYAMNSPSRYMESRWRDIKILRKR